MTDWLIAWRDVVRLVKGYSPSKFIGLRRVQELRRYPSSLPRPMQLWLLALTFIPHCVAVAVQVVAHQRRLQRLAND